jgi:hypothetical protein
MKQRGVSLLENLYRNTYFAAANSTRGFVSFFSEVFSPDALDEILIIKGGPGTGKSRFLRDIAAYYESIGEKVTYFLCSSDPQSLDGILIEGIKKAIIDGTAPHMKDPVYPVAVERILNLADFCDPIPLKAKKEKIRDLNKQKANAFKRAYSFLRAAGEVEKEIYHSVENDILYTKMESAAYRFCHKYLKEEAVFSEDIRLISAVNHVGFMMLDSYDAEATIVCGVDNSKGLSWLFLREVYRIAKEMNKKVLISYDPLFPDRLNGIFFVKEKICIRVAEEKGNESYEHYINMGRFINKNISGVGKNRIRFAQKCRMALLAGAVEQFGLAKENHMKLESIYSAHMDFKAKEMFTDRFIKQLQLE